MQQGGQEDFGKITFFFDLQHFRVYPDNEKMMFDEDNNTAVRHC